MNIDTSNRAKAYEEYNFSPKTADGKQLAKDLAIGVRQYQEIQKYVATDAYLRHKGLDQIKLPLDPAQGMIHA